MDFINIIYTTFYPTIAKLTATVILAFLFLFGDAHIQGVIAVFMLIVIDTIMGIWATYYEGQAITSRKFSRVVQKATVYFLAISTGYFTDVAIGMVFIQAGMIAFVGITECISILENIGRLGYQTPKKLLNQLKDFQSKK